MRNKIDELEERRMLRNEEMEEEEEEWFPIAVVDKIRSSRSN